jgi:hypothetical protein
MAYIVRSRGRRYEIRESVATPEGPRSRTLATFAVLDDATLASARSRSGGTIDGPALRRAAIRVGAPVADRAPDAAARRLVAELAAGHRPTPALASLLRRALDAADVPITAEVAGDMELWVDADDERRGRALVELLELGDQLPVPRRGPLDAPRLAPPG